MGNEPRILKLYRDNSCFMRETAARPVRCFECNASRKRMYYYWLQTPDNPQEGRGRFDLPFCCVDHYRRYMKKNAPNEKITLDSEKWNDA